MKTITFYSYKGGVGRTLALANITNRLSEFNKKICLLDFDLEAPGLPHKFTSQLHPQAITKGIVDYIYEYYVNGILPETIKEYTCSFQIYGNKEVVNFIPAGNTNSPEYWKKLSAINWYDLLYESQNGIAFFLDLKEKIRKELNPDFLLIDSRTGITETSGITTSLLADEVVVMSANNKENLEGAQKIIKSLCNPENSILGNAPKITFVLSRVPFTDKPEDRAKEQSLIARVKALFETIVVNDINVIHSDRELEENETLKIGYDKEDYSKSQVSRDYLKLFEEITKSDLSDAEIERFKEIKLSERFYASSLAEENNDVKIHRINEAIKLDTQNIEFRKYRIGLYINEKNYDEAISECTSIIMLRPNDVFFYLILSAIYSLKNEFHEMIDVLNNAKKIDSKNSLVYEGLGLAYYKLGNYPYAVSYFTIGIELNPSFALLYNHRANAHKSLGELEKALQDVYKSIELDSESPLAYTTLAEINAEYSRDNEFYINLDTALRLAEEIKRTKNEIDYLKSIETFIKTDQIYQRFYQKERFQRILEKYNIILLGEHELN